MALISFKRHVGLVLVAFALFTLTSCNPMVFPVASPAKANWKAYVVYDETVPVTTKNEIDKEFDQFLRNSNMSIIKFTEAADTTEADMIVHVRKFEHVSKGRQATGAIVSFLGLTVVPFGIVAAGAPVTVFFWYTPKTHSTATMYVHDGENNAHVRKKTYRLLGPGFLRGQLKQEMKHSKAYHEYFKRVLKYYNHQIMAAKRKGLATTR